MRTSRDAVLAAVLCGLVIFLAWWWWPRTERLEQPPPAPLPKNIANRKAPVPANLESAQFKEVKTPEGETGFVPSLSTGQAARLKKGEVITIGAPGGGAITITPLEDSTKKTK
jgi:hypothetical protein